MRQISTINKALVYIHNFLGHYQGDSLTRSMLIFHFINFQLGCHAVFYEFQSIIRTLEFDEIFSSTPSLPLRKGSYELFVCLFEINNLKKEDSSIYQDERLTLPVLCI